MKKVFSDKSKIVELWIEQTQDFAGTPLSVVRDSNIKCRKLFFIKDTIYSYRESYPLAKLVGDKIFIKEETYSRTTSNHRFIIFRVGTIKNKKIMLSDDLKTPNLRDRRLEIALKKLINSRISSKYYIAEINHFTENNEDDLITKSKFPILFNEKHKKLKEMLFSQDKEVFKLAVKIIKQQKLL